MKAPESHQYGADGISLASLELLSSAVREIELAVVEPTPARRYLRGYVVAVRAAAAVLATRADKDTSDGPRNVWVLLPKVAPELQEWSMFFAAGTGKQAALAAGLDRAVTERESDDLVRDAHNFLDVVVSALMRGSRAAPSQIRIVG
jgi:hypothetical protein